MWLKVYKISSVLAIMLFIKMQYFGESFYSEDSEQAKSNLHQGSGRSHTSFHK